MPDSKSFKDLEELWYRQLKEAGFKEIESINHPSRPLKEWHNFKFAHPRLQLIQAARSQYQGQIDGFTNHPSFDEACTSLLRHGNCKFSLDEVYIIWDLHCHGYSRREIARHFDCWKSRIDFIIKGLIEWMMLA